MKPTPQILTRISITKAPPGSSVSLDHGPAKLADQTGNITIPTTPGDHKITVTKDGFDPITDDSVTVSQGETLGYPAPLAKTVVGQPMGTLQVNFTPQEDMKQVRVFVDGANHGAVSPGGTIRLSAGHHSVQYKGNGYDDSPVKDVNVAENGTIPDTASLNKAAPKPTGSLSADKSIIEKGQSVTLSWQVNNIDNKAAIAISGIGQGLKPKDSKTVTPSGSTTYILTAGNFKVGEATVTLKDAPPPPPPPSVDYFNVNTDSIEVGRSVTLNWRVSNASSVTINGQSVPSQGSKSFTPSGAGTTKYDLAANGVTLQSQSVTVTAPPPPQPKQEQAPAAAPAAAPVATLPDASALEHLLAPYNGTLNSALPQKKDCKAKAGSVYGGTFKDIAEQWCGVARSITMSESDCHVTGTADAPVLRCTVAIGITPLSGESSSGSTAKSFHFQKNGDSYTLTTVTGR
jgi:hypothetical protein